VALFRREGSKGQRNRLRDTYINSSIVCKSNHLRIQSHIHWRMVGLS